MDGKNGKFRHFRYFSIHITILVLSVGFNGYLNSKILMGH